MDLITHLVKDKKFSGVGRRAPVMNPATGRQIREVVLGDQTVVDAAVGDAVESGREWAKKTPIFRARVMLRYSELIRKNIGSLAKVVSEEHGKTIPDAQGSITRGIEVVEFASGFPSLAKGEYSPQVGTGVNSFNFRQPLGVCAGITPFNFPAMVPLWMMPVALVCGNAFILKPSEKDPSCSRKLVELAHEAGVPEATVQMINGDKEVVDGLLTHTCIDAVSFVGSSPVAQYIFNEGSKNGKRVQALGGAKNHLVVMPDSDVATVVDALIGSAFGSAGERCMAISVAVCVGDDTADRTVKRLVEKAGKLTVGPGSDLNSDFGPVNNEGLYKKILDYIDIGVDEGADLIMDGRSINIPGFESGYFIGATVFDNVSENMKIYQEEIFGPVLSVVRVQTYEEAIDLLNKHPLGNGASIFTGDGGVAQHFVENCQAGMVGVNIPIPVPVAYHSFGGWKGSLFGGFAMHGPEGIRFYTKLKTASVSWGKTSLKGPEFKLPTYT